MRDQFGKSVAFDNFEGRYGDSAQNILNTSDLKFHTQVRKIPADFTQVK